MLLDPNVWGPHYWFVLHTIAINYPLTPNEVTKKKYYDFVQNLPLFLPEGTNFNEFLDRYPVSPYLDSRESFMKWVHFIHNKINFSLGKESISFEEAMNKYYKNYKPNVVKSKEERERREKFAFIGIVFFLLIISIAIYRK